MTEYNYRASSTAFSTINLQSPVTTTQRLGAEGVSMFSKGFQKHHIIPLNVWTQFGDIYSDIFQAAFDDGNEGFRINSANNLAWMPSGQKDALSLGAGMHRGQHPEYEKNQMRAAYFGRFMPLG